MKRAYKDIGSSTNDQPPSKERRFEHIDGNWPCHLQISFTSTDTDSDSDSDSNVCMNNNIADTIETLASSTSSYLTDTYPKVQIFPADRPLHISLCHTFILRHHQINLFLDAIKKELSTTFSFPLILTNSVVRFTNQNKTRDFYALKAEGGSDAVCLLIEHVNKVLQRLGQPSYHKDPKIHVSFGWSPSKKTATTTATTNTNTCLDDDEERKAAKESVTGSEQNEKKSNNNKVATLEAVLNVTTVTCTIGNKIEYIQLLKKR